MPVVTITVMAKRETIATARRAVEACQLAYDVSPWGMGRQRWQELEIAKARLRMIEKEMEREHA
jgi:hypothetical protein